MSYKHYNVAEHRLIARLSGGPSAVPDGLSEFQKQNPKLSSNPLLRQKSTVDGVESRLGKLFSNDKGSNDDLASLIRKILELFNKNKEPSNENRSPNRPGVLPQSKSVLPKSIPVFKAPDGSIISAKNGSDFPNALSSINNSRLPAESPVEGNDFLKSNDFKKFTIAAQPQNRGKMVCMTDQAIARSAGGYPWGYTVLGGASSQPKTTVDASAKTEAVAKANTSGQLDLNLYVDSLDNGKQEAGFDATATIDQTAATEVKAQQTVDVRSVTDVIKNPQTRKLAFNPRASFPVQEWDEQTGSWKIPKDARALLPKLRRQYMENAANLQTKGISLQSLVNKSRQNDLREMKQWTPIMYNHYKKLGIK